MFLVQHKHKKVSGTDAYFISWRNSKVFWFKSEAIREMKRRAKTDDDMLFRVIERTERQILSTEKKED